VSSLDVIDRMLDGRAVNQSIPYMYPFSYVSVKKSGMKGFDDETWNQGTRPSALLAALAMSIEDGV
jgi:hypothetical protein